MLTIEALRGYGANVDEGLARCMGNEQLYLSLVNVALNDSTFEKLYKAMDSGDLKTAFESAHALKGVLGNLSLTPLYDAVAELTDDLRKPDDSKDYTQKLQRVTEEKRRLDELKDDWAG